MNAQVFNYSVIPSIVRADEESVVRIRPLGENGFFKPDLTYTVSIRAVDTACRHYNDLPTDKYEIKPDENGELVIRHFFAGEQKHVIFITRPEEDMRSMYYEINNHRGRFGENASVQLAVYSLRSDLYGMRCYKGEVHCHTCESDGIQDVCHTVGNYRTCGYDFMAITDHYITMGAEKAKRIFDTAPVDMTLFLGEECHVPTEQIHAVHMGGRESVTAYFRNHPAEAEQEMLAIEAELNLPAHINRRDYAWRVWIARKARDFGGIAILAHPHWIWFETYFMASAITEQLLTDGIYDALDITDQEADTTVALWAEMQAQGHRIPVVGCTDSHYTDANNPHRPARGGYTLVFAPDRSEQNILTAIREGRSIAVNAAGDPERPQGPYRFVKFARFLLDNYYPVYKRLCHNQGVLMAEFPTDTSPTDETLQLLRMLNDRSEAFAHAFFGY